MRVLRLLRQPVPLLLWIGQLFSVTGDQLYAMAVLWLVLQLTGSAKFMALVSMAESVPYVVVGLLGAGVISRAGRLRALVRINLVSAAIVAVIPLTYLAGLRSVAWLVAIAACLSALEALFDPAMQAVIPDLVPAADLQPMVALADSTDRLARVLGPGSAGLLLVVLPEIHLFTFDAATFLVSAVTLSFVIRRGRQTAPVPMASTGANIAIFDGFREVARRPTLRTGLAVRGTCNLVWSAFTIGLPFLLVDRLHAGLASYGFLLGAFGLGNLGGNLLSGSPRVGRHLLTVYCVAWSLVGLGFLGLAVSPSLGAAVAATIWMGICTPLANVSMDTYIAQVVPAERLAHVYALQRIVVAGASAAGVFGVAVALEHVGPEAVIAGAGAWMVVVGLVALTSTRRRQQRATQPGPGQSE
jgi:MFS family permease